jgi:hypothetical protein
MLLVVKDASDCCLERVYVSDVLFFVNGGVIHKTLMHVLGQAFSIY